jgi:lysophospholipase L1-like esterase
LIQCIEGAKITYSAYGHKDVATIIFFDGNGSVVDYVAYAPTGSEIIGTLSGTVTVPEGAKTFRCCTFYLNLKAYFFKYITNDNLVDTLEYLDNKTAGSTSPWKNKTIDCLGDSITYGAGLSNPTAERWSTILSELTGATCNNYGVSGSKVSEISGDAVQSFVERYSSMDDADLVIIFGGTNDYWHAATEVGTLGNLDTSTFIGALSTIFVNLVAKSPITQIVFVFPYQQYYSGSSTRADKGHGTFKAFRDAAKSVCEFYSVPMLDLFSDSGFDVIDSEVQRTALTSDGLHANKYGQIYLAKRIKAFIDRINCIL